MIAQLNILDVVALLGDLPDRGLMRGQVGTVVEELGEGIYEVEFSDDDGHMYASLALRTDQLMRLHHRPTAAADGTVANPAPTPGKPTCAARPTRSTETPSCRRLGESSSVASTDPDAVIPIYWPLDQLEAAAIQQALKDEGIWSHLEGEHQSSWSSSGFFGNAGRWKMRLLARVADAERAKEIIEAGSWPHYN